jgi:hypothetical protein
MRSTVVVRWTAAPPTKRHPNPICYILKCPLPGADDCQGGSGILTKREGGCYYKRSLFSLPKPYAAKAADDN